MAEEWRLLNLGEIPWIRTQSIYHAIALLQEELKTPNTLIINWPDEPFVCVGLHQVIETSIDLENISNKSLPYIRRACGGGSVFLNDEQIFYQIICRETDYPSNLQKFYAIFLQPTVVTYKDFGIAAEFAPVNDVVAENRKISGNGAVTYNNSRVLVGNFILNFPSKNMSQILKVPDEKFRDKVAKTLEERMGSFSYFLDNTPSKDEIISSYVDNFEKFIGVRLKVGFLQDEELKKIEELEQLYQTDEWKYYVEKTGLETFQQKIKSGTYLTNITRKLPGGLISLFIQFDSNKISDILISGDFSLSPPFSLPEIESELKGTNVDYNLIRSKLGDLFDDHNIEIPGIEKEELAMMIIDSYSSLKK